MTNLEKYNQIFIDIFDVKEEELGDNFTKAEVENWDSVRQMNILSQFEETFDVILDPEDMMTFKSYNAGKKILAKNNIAL